MPGLQLRIVDGFFYPDVFVRCGDRPDDKYYRTDPVMIAEVLSPSTRRYDKRDNLTTYRTIDSLQDYLLIEQDLMRVVIHRTGQDQPQELTRPDERLELSSIGFSMTLAALYA